MKPVLPARVLSRFPAAEPSSPADDEIIHNQLGRRPQGDTFVAARCPHGRPAVLLTVPFQGSGRPTPPPLWLSCPSAARAAARLESTGLIRLLQCRLEEEQECRARFEEEEREIGLIYAGLAEYGGTVPAERFLGRGVAGGRQGAVKCLHAHLAHRLASGVGQVGRWVLDEIDRKGGCWCDKAPDRCRG